MTVYVGTSGFHYKEWIGPVYPPGTKSSTMLERFAGMFHALEINSTFYRPPSKDMFKKYPDRTGGEMKIVVKLHGVFTHTRNAGSGDVATFDEAVKPLVNTGQFVCYLAQFPQSFHNTGDARKYIEKLKDMFPDIPLVCEFRHKSWWDKDMLEFLKTLSISMSTVDGPEIESLPPGGATFTCNPAYVRLHGRNKDNWYDGAEERYRYKYKRSELEGILKKVQKLVLKSDEVFVVFNNHPLGNAPINANEFIEMLREVLPGSIPPAGKFRPNEIEQTSLF
ncbi:MAG: DUF72 domain-containing protein [bacterium]|nr:DUF72 domain-containing protein [bacterium]